MAVARGEAPSLGPGSLSGGSEPAFPSDAVEVGRVLGAWGVKGWIKVQPFSVDPQALFSSKRWFLKPEQSRWDGPACLRVVEARDQGGMVVAHVQDIDDRDAAQALRGMSICVSRGSFPTASSDEHYWVDLIGLRVVNRQAQVLGEVVGLLDTGVHSVLRVRPTPADTQAAGAERLIPFVGAYIDEVDTAGGRIVADWGLDY